MKKQLLALALLSAGITNAQTWSENFSSTTAPGLPANWLQNNVDGKTVTSALSAYGFGTNAWVTRDFTSSDPAHGKVVASTSYYSPAGASNDWLITPSFTVPANGVLEWDAVATDASYPDGYQVKISTTGTLTTDFSTNLLTVPAETSSWNTRGLSLNTYSNQVVRIAFVNNSNDMFLLWLDNIKVIVPAVNDGNVVSITGLTRYMVGAGNQNITGSFRSKGYAPVSNATLNYKVNSGAVVTQTMSFSTALNYNDAANYSFTTPANLALGTNNVKVWVSQVNGVGETIFTNDTVSNVVFVASQSALRNTLIEEFSSSTCAPCASLNSTFDPFINTNNPNTGGRVNIIKNQVNWPSPGTDPSYNPHSAARVTYYDISAAPTTLIDGTSEMQYHNQAEIDAAKLIPAYATITASLTATPSGTVSASAVIIPHVTISSASVVRVHQALLQSTYTYTAGTTSQKNYFHVMRKMFPNAAGSAVATTDGTPINVSMSQTIAVLPVPAQGSYDFWKATNLVFEYVVFLQDQVSNDILQSGSAMINGPVGLVELKDNQQIGIYPNPAKDFAVIGVKLNQASDIAVSVYDITGKVVYSNNASKVEAGQNEIQINTTEFASGTYNVVVTTESGILKDKLIVVK